MNNTDLTDHTIELNNFKISNKYPITLISGPCQLESLEHAMMIAEKLIEICDGNAINFGSKLVQTKYFLASNPDLQGINEKSLIKFLNAANILKDKFSTIGPRYENANPKSLVQIDINNEISEIKVISGACMLFNKKNFDEIGGFDENFFLYFEENDFCIRALQFNKNFQINTTFTKVFSFFS